MRRTLWQVSVQVARESEEAVVELLDRMLGRSAHVFWSEETGETHVTAYLDRRQDFPVAAAEELRQGLGWIRACGLDTGPATISVKRLRRQDWAESWKRHFKPLLIGRALLLKPSWSRRRPGRGQVMVVLDPGLSFGTGQHPTTRFCLEQLVACRGADRKRSFLDLGTGSGILAIAAAKLGYGPIEAHDFDPEAVRVARANARRNRVEGKLRVQHRDLTKLPRRAVHPFDVVCANLIFDLLLAERRRILARVRPGGRLVLAGILTRQFAAVREAFERMGARLVLKTTGGEWTSGMFQKAAVS
jgi:ribosomal protein L11 methyltransferase